MRFYEQKYARSLFSSLRRDDMSCADSSRRARRYPAIDELVMVQVKQIQEMGAYVKLVSLLIGSVLASDVCV